MFWNQIKTAFLLGALSGLSSSVIGLADKMVLFLHSYLHCS